MAVAICALSSAPRASATCYGVEVAGNCYPYGHLPGGEETSPEARKEEEELKAQEAEIEKLEAEAKADERRERNERGSSQHHEYLASVPVYGYRLRRGVVRAWLVGWTTDCAGPLEIPLYRTPLWSSDARTRLPSTAKQVRLSSPAIGASIPGWRVSLAEGNFGSALAPHLSNWGSVVGLRVSHGGEMAVFAQPSAACTPIATPASSVEAWGQDDPVKVTFAVKKRVVIGYRKERRVT